jgi:hypothetical protein
VSSKVKVFLDNNIWNMLAEESGPVTLPEVVAACAVGRIEIVGSVELFGELMATARRKPAKYVDMRRLWHVLVGRRALHAMRERHCIEARCGGRATEIDRYFPYELAGRDSLSETDLSEVNDQIYEQKRRSRELHTRLKNEMRDAISDAGYDFGSFDPEFSADLLRGRAYGFVEAVRLKFDLPPIVEAGVSVERVPSTWLFSASLLALMKRWAKDDIRLQDSDGHDLWHASCGAYYDILVTDDGAFRMTLAEIERLLPFEVLDPADFAKWLDTGHGRAVVDTTV